MSKLRVGEGREGIVIGRACAQEASRVLAGSVCRTTRLVKTYGAVHYALCPFMYRLNIKIKYKIFEKRKIGGQVRL